jgi:hypothetical protein
MTAPSSRPPAAAPAHLALAHLAATMVRLTDIVERETAALRLPGMPGLAALHEEKARLSQAYAKASAELASDPRRLASVAPRIRAEVRAGAGRLAEALARNEKMLRATTVATDRVLGTVVRALKQRRGATATYARPRAGGNAASLPSGLTLDQRF